MKKITQTTLKSLILGGIILLGVGFISAEYAPPPGNPLAGDPPPLVNVSANDQAKSGTLKIGEGQVAGPNISFDVLGVALTTSTAIFGDAEIRDTLYVGTRDADPVTFPKEPVTVAVDGETIVDNLSGMGIIPVCAEPDGKLRPCYVHPSVIVYPACSDQVDNDGDGLVDFPDDPGCTAANDQSEADGVAYTCTPVASNVPFSMNVGDTVCVDGIHELTLTGVQPHTTCPSGATCYDDWVFLYTDPVTGQTTVYLVPNNTFTESEAVIFGIKFAYRPSTEQFTVINGL